MTPNKIQNRHEAPYFSFPGGKVDELLDQSLLDTALRETFEEINISKDRVELLGSIGPPEKSLRGDTVWPFVVINSHSPCL